MERMDYTKESWEKVVELYRELEEIGDYAIDKNLDDEKFEEWYDETERTIQKQLVRK